MHGRCAQAIGGLVVAVALLGGAPAQAATVTETADIPMDDATTLRATVFRPATSARVPAVVVAGPYGVGEATSPSAVQGGAPPGLLEDDIAVVDVSVRGTGCSGGAFDPFSTREATDIAAVVEWVAGRPWSSGRVGMAGGSYLATTQLFAAALKPPHLDAIAPITPIADVYRDVARPGGVLDAHLPILFAGIPATSEGQAGALATRGDGACAAAIAERARSGASGWLTTTAATQPLDGSGYRAHSAIELAPRITAPALITVALQDLIVRTGAAALPRRLAGPSRLVLLNGLHDTPELVPELQQRTRAWLAYWLRDRYARGQGNRNRSRHARHTRPRHHGRNAARRTSPLDTQAVTVLYEVRASDLTPGFQRTYATWPPGGRRMVLNLSGGGALSASTGTDGSDGLSLLSLGLSGTLSYTSAPLIDDVLLTGEAAAHLFVNAGAPDADLFATLSEVRPDGTVVRIAWAPQRMALRLTDASRSGPGSPYHPFTTRQDMPMGTPEPVDVAFGPVAHLLRAGSRVRLTLGAPPPAGDPLNDPSYTASSLGGLMTIVHGAGAPSALDLPVVDTGATTSPALGCGAVVGEACR